MPCFSGGSQPAPYPDLAQSLVSIVKKVTLPPHDVSATLIRGHTPREVSSFQIPPHSRQASCFLILPSFLPGNIHETLLCQPFCYASFSAISFHILSHLLQTKSFPLAFVIISLIHLESIFPLTSSVHPAHVPFLSPPHPPNPLHQSLLSASPHWNTLRQAHH